MLEGMRHELRFCLDLLGRKVGAILTWLEGTPGRFGRSGVRRKAGPCELAPATDRLGLHNCACKAEGPQEDAGRILPRRRGSIDGRTPPLRLLGPGSHGEREELAE